MATLNARSENRIAYHRSQYARRQGLLARYSVGSKGYERTLKAMQKDLDIINGVAAGIDSRTAEAEAKAEAARNAPPKVYGGRGPKGPTGPRGPLKGEKFSFAVGPDLTVANDVDVDADGQLIAV